MALQKKNFFQRRTKPRGPRSNERIHANEVQVISSDGKNLGTLSTREAIEMAKQEGLDLIEISPNAKPPVCKIIDMGKYKYELQKKTHKAQIANHKHKARRQKNPPTDTFYGTKKKVTKMGGDGGR